MLLTLLADREKQFIDLVRSTQTIFEGQGIDSVRSLTEFSVETIHPDIVSTAIVDDPRMLFSDSEVYPPEAISARRFPRTTFLLHTDFSDLQCIQASEYPGGSDYVGAPGILQEAYGQRLFSPLQNVVDINGQNSKCSSLTNSPNCLSATTTNNEKIIIIEPYSDIVKVLDCYGNTIEKMAMQSGSFSKAISLSASNASYFILNLESTAYNGGCKYTIQERRIEDHSIVEYEIISDCLQSTATIDNDYLFREYLQSTQVLQQNADEAKNILSNQVLVVPNGIYSKGTIAEFANIVRSTQVLSDIKIELRHAAQRTAFSSQTRHHPEFNRFHQMFDAETDVFRQRKTYAPLRTEDMSREKPYNDVNPHYYGHPSHQAFAEEQGFSLDDMWFETNGPEETQDLLSPFAENTRIATSPVLIATESRLFIAISMQRGAYAWTDPRFASDDPWFRSSRTLFHEISLIERYVKKEFPEKAISMSGTMALHANDATGFALLDSFWEMGSDDKLEGYIDNNNRTIAPITKKLHLEIYDFNLERIAYQDLSSITTLTPGTHPVVHDIYTNAVVTANYFVPVHMLDMGTHYEADSAHSTHADPMLGKIIYNGCMRIDGKNVYVLKYGISGCRGYLTSTSQNNHEQYATDFQSLLHFDENLNIINKLLLAGNPRNLLAVKNNSGESNIYSRGVCTDAEYFPYIFSKIVISELVIESVRSLQTMNCNETIRTNSTFYESTQSVVSNQRIATKSYYDLLQIITNTSPNEALDQHYYTPAAYIDETYQRHPTNHMGVYPYGARFWNIGIGINNDLEEIEAWRVQYLKNIEADYINRDIPEIDDLYPESIEPFAYHSFPYPVQYVVDNINDVVFGLSRPAEGKNWQGNTLRFLNDNGLVDAVGIGTTIDCAGIDNKPPGGFLHKFDRLNDLPNKTQIIPGYLEPSIPSDSYDPFFQLRSFAVNTTEKRIYILRAFGRRDLFSTGTGITSNKEKPFAKDGDLELPYEMESLSLPAEPIPGMPYHANTVIADLGTPYGWAADDGNIAGRPENYKGTEYSSVKKVITFNNLSTPSEDQFNIDGSFKTELAIDYEQKANTYTNQDILIYDYNLSFIGTLPKILGIPQNETLLHFYEKNGSVYVLAQAKDESSFDFGNWHARLAVGQPTYSQWQDTKHGYDYRILKLYKIDRSIYGFANFVASLPWAGHSVGDILIQEITDTHAWLNWNGVHKARAGSCLGVGLKLDGSGYVEVPGLIAILPQEDITKRKLLCYNNTSKGSRYHFIDIKYQFSPFSDRRYLSAHAAERFPLWGDGVLTKLLVLDEENLQTIRKEHVYHPESDWYRPMDEGDGSYVNNWKTPVFSNDFYAGGPQPGYSQVKFKRQYCYVISKQTVNKAYETDGPRTWFKVTTGGPDIKIP